MPNPNLSIDPKLLKRIKEHTINSIKNILESIKLIPSSHCHIASSNNSRDKARGIPASPVTD